MITINEIPIQVNTQQEFTIKGTAPLELKGKKVTLTIDGQFSTISGNVADDGSWEVNFILMSPGERRIKISVESMSQTAIVKVVAMTSRLRWTNIPNSIKTGVAFLLEGEADDFDDGEELLILVDRQFVVARPLIQSGQWSAHLLLNQSGQRFVEVIASDQERIQTLLDVVPGDIQIIPRNVWRAQPPRASHPNLNAKRITIHHTVFPTLSSNARPDREEARMREIQNSHFSRGFSDIGYHFIVMSSGRIYEGRSDRKRGAHDTINDGFGISFDGSFQLIGSSITEEQFNSAVALCIQLCQRIGITDPTTLVSTPTAFPGNPRKNLPQILGHRDRFLTACPGVAGGTTVRLDAIRQAVKQALS